MLEEERKLGIEEGFKKGVEKGIEQGIEKGIEQGIKENQILTVKNMKNKNIDIAFISDITGLSIEEIEKL